MPGERTPVDIARREVWDRCQALNGFEGVHAEWNALLLSGLPATGSEFMDIIAPAARALLTAIPDRPDPRSVTYGALAEMILFGYRLRVAEEAREQ